MLACEYRQESVILTLSVVVVGRIVCEDESDESITNMSLKQLISTHRIICCGERNSYEFAQSVKMLVLNIITNMNINININNS